MKIIPKVRFELTRYYTSLNVLSVYCLPIPAFGHENKKALSSGIEPEKAEVLEVFGGDGIGYSKIPSGGEKLEYKAGAIVQCVKPFDKNRWNECSTGIHFYITREEAMND
jgi:hypothetical protein